MHVKSHDSVESLQNLARWERRPKVARRLQVVAMAQQQRPGAEIAELMGESPRTVQRWIRRYNDEGVDGLADRPRSGRPPKLPHEQSEAFRQRVDEGPKEDDGVSVLHGRDLQRILEREFQVMYSLDGVYKLLHRLKYSWLCPRPQHEHADTEQQKAFEKKL